MHLVRLTRLTVLVSSIVGLIACGGGSSSPPDAHPHPDAPTPPDANTTPDAMPAPSCDTLAQDCPTGMKCIPATVDPTTKKLTNACITAGTATPGMPCMPTMTGDACAKGSVCLGTGTGTSQCFGLCGTCDPSNTMDPCPSPMTSLCTPQGGMPTYCINVIVDNKMPPDYLGLICVPSCDPFAAAACPYTDAMGMAQTNGNCFYIPGGPVCDAPGTIATGADCTKYGDCVLGDACFILGPSTFKCEPKCDKTAMPTTCAMGQTCHDAMNADIPNLGYCM